MQWQQHLEKEGLVLFLEWDFEPVDDGSQDLQQVSHTVDLFPDIGPES